MRNNYLFSYKKVKKRAELSFMSSYKNRKKKKRKKVYFVIYYNLCLLKFIQNFYKN